MAKTFICHRQLMGKRLYVSRTSGDGSRDWGYAALAARAKKLTVVQASRFRADMDFLDAPAGCRVVPTTLSGSHRKR